MKHTSKLLALALACTGPTLAQAQSNVTIYGLLDVNVATEQGGGARRTGLDTSELNGSRLGYRGVEDLGNGQKALFTLEAAISPDTGASPGFSRQSFVGLEGSWGRLTAGRQYSPAFDALDPYEATGGADRSPGLLHRKSGSVARGYQVRFDNMVKYRSPELAGFTGEAALWSGLENASGDEDSRREGRGYGLAALYKNGPLSAGLTTQSYITNASGGRASTHGIAGAYQLDFAKLYALYTRDRESGSQGSGKASSYAVGAEIPVGAAGTVALSWGARNESGEAEAEDAAGAAVYYLHSLSKRTTLYAGYSQLDNKDQANYGFNFTPEAGATVRVLMAGIRHRF